MIQFQQRAGDGPPAGPAAEGREREPLVAHAEEIAGHVSRLMRIWALRARVRTQRLAFLVVAGVVGAFVLCVVSFSAARLLVGGLALGLTELAGGRAWLGELGAGLLLLAGVFGALAWLRRATERELLKGLRSDDAGSAKDE